MYNRIGFHISPGGYAQGLGGWMQALDAAEIPFCIKGCDYAGPVWEGQELAKASGVPHVLIYRRSGQGWDVPDYDRLPAEAARIHWDKHRAKFPPELDPGLVWLETVNEVYRMKANWLGEFAYHTGLIALEEGYRWAAFGFASGTPEREHWEKPGMQKYLRLAAQHPGRLAVALHEYSYTVADIWHEFPYKIGRFQMLFDVCDQYGIGRPTTLITEWGWEYEKVPAPEVAMAHVAGVAELYAQHPQILGASLWHLGGGYGGIAQQAQKLIAPVRDFTLSTVFDDPVPPVPPSPEPDPGLPRVQYGREYWVVPAGAPIEARRQIYLLAAEAQVTCGPSYDDAGIGALEEKAAVLWEVAPDLHLDFVAWYKLHYPGTIVGFRFLGAE